MTFTRRAYATALTGALLWTMEACGADAHSGNTGGHGDQLTTPPPSAPIPEACLIAIDEAQGLHDLFAYMILRRGDAIDAAAEDDGKTLATIENEMALLEPQIKSGRDEFDRAALMCRAREVRE